MLFRSKAGSIVVPAGAVWRRAGQAPFVYVVENKQARKRVVKTGLEEADGFEITSGLAAGDTVVVEQNLELAEGVGDLPVHQLELPRIKRNLEIAQAIEHAVEYLARPPKQARLRAVAAHAVDNFVALFPALDELRDEFGRVLQIRRDHHHHGVAFGATQRV